MIGYDFEYKVYVFFFFFFFFFRLAVYCSGSTFEVNCCRFVVH
jgi:hypothetical protein